MKTTPMTEELYTYVMGQCDLPTPVLEELAHETGKLSDWFMQISKDQGAFMHMLVKLIGAKKALEIGCYTGFSAISVASALPDDGKLVSLDINEEVVKFAKTFFEKAGVADKIDVRVAPAKSTLEKMKAEFAAESFDIAFIDADKESLQDYFDYCMHFVRRNGLIICDNVIWSGKIVDASDTSPPTMALRKFNKAILNDSRVERVMLHISDGLYLLRKK